jgi:hypothetical protein
VLRLVIETVRTCYPSLDDHSGRAVICTASPKNVKREVSSGSGQTAAVALVKYGFHVIFPEVLVDKLDALGVRECILRNVTSKLGQKYIESEGSVYKDSWENVIDASVLKENGLRMLGANKTEKCPVQHTAEKCYTCQGMDKLNAHRPYSVVRVVNGSGLETKKEVAECIFLQDPANYAAALAILSLRRHGARKLPVTFLEGIQVCGEKRQKLLHDTGMRSRDLLFLPGQSKVNSSSWITYTQLDRGIITTFLTFIKKMYSIEGIWEKWVQIRSVAICTSGSVPKARFFPEYNYCPHAAREHTSNRVFIELAKDHESGHYFLDVNCFSRNCTGTTSREEGKFRKKFTVVGNTEAQICAINGTPPKCKEQPGLTFGERKRCLDCFLPIREMPATVAARVCVCAKK